MLCRVAVQLIDIRAFLRRFYEMRRDEEMTITMTNRNEALGDKSGRGFFSPFSFPRMYGKRPDMMTRSLAFGT